MKNLYILVEGQTEVAFVKNVLSSYLINFDINVIPRAVETSKKGGKTHRGGVTSYVKVHQDLTCSIRSHPRDYFTTMFDYYALPTDFPGMGFTCSLRGESAVSHIEAEFKQNIGHRNFIPYIQLHEFEALLFSDIQKLELEYPTKHKEVMRLATDVTGLKPEEINTKPETAPSRRILSYIPSYDKVTSGVNITLQIGIDRLRLECPHFDSWIRAITAI